MNEQVGERERLEQAVAQELGAVVAKDARLGTATADWITLLGPAEHAPEMAMVYAVKAALGAEATAADVSDARRAAYEAQALLWQRAQEGQALRQGPGQVLSTWLGARATPAQRRVTAVLVARQASPAVEMACEAASVELFHWDGEALTFQEPPQMVWAGTEPWVERVHRALAGAAKRYYAEMGTGR